jgi:hypothetical protein
MMQQCRRHTYQPKEKTVFRKILAVLMAPIVLVTMWILATQPLDTTPLEQIAYLLAYLLSAMTLVYSLGWFDE